MPDESLPVLVIKDKPAAAEAIKAKLESAGFKVVLAPDVESVMEQLENGAYLLLVTGENLVCRNGRTYNGRTLINWMRKHDKPELRELPVVAYTGFPWYRGEIQLRRAAGDNCVAHVRPTVGGLPSLLENVKELVRECA